MPVMNILEYIKSFQIKLEFTIHPQVRFLVIKEKIKWKIKLFSYKSYGSAKAITTDLINLIEKVLKSRHIMASVSITSLFIEIQTFYLENY